MTDAQLCLINAPVPIYIDRNPQTPFSEDWVLAGTHLVPWIELVKLENLLNL
jgi:hypothetical protein